MKQPPASRATERNLWLLVHPHGFTQRATTGMNATLSYYYHYALLSVGSELMAAFETALAPVALSPIAMEAVSLGVSQEQITTFLLPVQSSMHPLYNPDLDYSIYLSQPFFYVLFQILILLITVYIIGSELKFHTAQEWLNNSAGKYPHSSCREVIALYFHLLRNRYFG